MMTKIKNNLDALISDNKLNKENNKIENQAKAKRVIKISYCDLISSEKNHFICFLSNLFLKLNLGDFKIHSFALLHNKNDENKRNDHSFRTNNSILLWIACQGIFKIESYFQFKFYFISFQN